jgi:hypothetical protein
MVYGTRAAYVKKYGGGGKARSVVEKKKER